MLNDAVYERARLARDARFDGRFFIGVKTTGIYCRPICPAVAPKSANVSFYPSAAAAAEAGFRPCLRCRPECAPGTPAWNGTSTTVSRGLRLIADGALDEGGIEDLADRLGVTGRHLRRLFAEHVGASPLAVAHTQRLHFAKRLLDETQLPMTHVATAAGYGSVRRFNDAFRASYGRSPRELRKQGGAAQGAAGPLCVRLHWREPYNWNALLAFLAGRATPGVEQVIGDAYLRSVGVDGQAGVIECRPDHSRGVLRLYLHGIEAVRLLPVVERLRELFDLDAPVTEIGEVLGTDALLATRLAAAPGLRVPGSWDGFELTLRAILGQQVSVKAATTLAGRVAERYGERFELPATLAARRDELRITRLFPTPGRLARARLAGLGLVGKRADTIRRVALTTADGGLRFDRAQDTAEFTAALRAIPGIGDWTAQYVLMRGLKYPDAFPATDLGLVKASGLAPAALARRAEAWRPWRAYAALLLWNSLTGSGG
jgi:AraC family transcriptional regulator of adaptative response / DNA-3-methyladenine glycosylase II